MVSTSNSHVNKKVCQFCGKLVIRAHISRHEIICSLKPNGLQDLKQYECEKCAKVFNRSDNLKRHSSSCQVTQSHKKLTCSYPNCLLTFWTRVDLIEHIKHSHDASVIQQVVTKTFLNWKEFETWKEKEEHRTFSFYAKKSGKNMGKTDYFYCQKEGSSKAHCKNGGVSKKTSRKVKSELTKEKNICISFMIVEYQESGMIHLKYYPTHGPECQKGTKFREIRKKRLMKNLKFLIDKVKSDELEINVLTKMDSDINTLVNHVEACKSTELNNSTPQMIATTSLKSMEKLETQQSQLLPFKRIKKKRSVTSTNNQKMVQVAREEVVLEDSQTYVLITAEEPDENGVLNLP